MVRMGGRQWSVRKRYSQFDQFRMVRAESHKQVVAIAIPPATISLSGGSTQQYALRVQRDHASLFDFGHCF